MFELLDSSDNQANIKVVGVGGGGGNAVAHMLTNHIEGVEFICANTDAQALEKTDAPVQIQLGQELTRGLGAGANPEFGRMAAEADDERLQNVLSGADMVFVTAGMGGGTGTGAAPVIARIARDMGILTVAVVTKPFGFEGKKRMDMANAGIQELEQNVDSLITIPNEKLVTVMGKNASLLDAFKAANSVLNNAVQGISELITREGLINVDFADVRTVMSEMGSAMMGSGVATGDNRATEATEMAIHSPLLEDINLSGAHGILVNITAGFDLSIGEFEEVGNLVRNIASESATIVAGTVIDPEMEGELRVTVVATGLDKAKPKLLEESMELQLAAGEQTQLLPPVEENADETPVVAKAPVAETKPVSEQVNYDDYDKPAVMRQQSKGKKKRVANAPHVLDDDPATEAAQNFDFLDVPSFLRNQAD